MIPGFLGLLWHFERQENLGEAGGHGLGLGGVGFEPVGPQLDGAGIANAGDEADHAHEADLVLAVHGELHEGGDVFDMRLLKEAQTTGDLKRDAALGELHLDLHAVEVRTVEHGDVVEFRAFVLQLEHALRDEGGLRGGIVEGDERGQHALRLACRREIFRNLPAIHGDGGIGEVQHLRHAAVVHLDLVGAGTGPVLVEFEDVRDIGAAPGVDGLRVIAHDHEIALRTGEQLDEAALEAVGVLILIDEDELELTAVALQQVFVFLQQLHGEREEVVKVHAVGLALLFLVESAHL